VTDREQYWRALLKDRNAQIYATKVELDRALRRVRDLEELVETLQRDALGEYRADVADRIAKEVQP
jgi:hypothetical protein